MIGQTGEKVLKAVGEAFKRDPQAVQYGLHVVPDVSREEDDWVYVIVAPTMVGIRAYDLVDLLAKIEKEVREQLNPHILLLPASGAREAL